LLKFFGQRVMGQRKDRGSRVLHSAVYYFAKSESFPNRAAYCPSSVRSFVDDSEIETGPPRKGANTSVAVDGLTQRLDIIRVVEKTPDLSTVAPGQQLGIAFAICGFALCGICGDGLAPPIFSFRFA
jgi:hypothetical protein